MLYIEGVTLESSFSEICQKISTLKDRLIQGIKEFCQWITNFVSRKLAKLFHMEQITVGQKYYNEVMSTIKSVMKVDTTSINKTLMAFHTIRNDAEKVDKYGGEIAEKLIVLEDYAEKVKDMKPSEDDRLLTFSTSKLKTFQSELYKLRDEAQRKIIAINKIKTGHSEIEELKYTKTQLLLIAQLNAVTLKKAQIAIELMSKLMTNCTIVDDNKGGSESMNNDSYTYAQDIPSIEGFISYCDDMMIAEESYRDAKKIYKQSKDEMLKSIEECDAMPEGTIDECKYKISAYDKINTKIHFIRSKICTLRPSKFESIRDTLMKLTTGTASRMAGNILYHKTAGASVQSPNLSGIAQDIALCIGVDWTAQLVSTYTSSSHIQRKIIGKLDELLNKITLECRRLNIKRNALLEKEKEKGPKKEKEG